MTQNFVKAKKLWRCVCQVLVPRSDLYRNQSFSCQSKWNLWFGRGDFSHRQWKRSDSNRKRLWFQLKRSCIFEKQGNV